MTVHRSITAIKIAENGELCREIAFIHIGGVLACSCGTAKCPRKKGKAVRNYYQVVRLVASEGYECPFCGTTYNGLLADIQTIKKWKNKFPQWPWKKMKIIQRKK